MVFQQALAIVEQLDLQPSRVTAPCGQQAAQPVLHGQRHLHSARPAADDTDTENTGAAEHALLQVLPTLQPGVDGLDRHRMRQRALHVCHTRARPDVDRQQVEIDRRTPVNQHLPLVEVQPLRRGVVEACTGKTCQRPQIDMTVVVAVVTGDQTRKHP